MKDQPANGNVPAGVTGALGLPVVVDRAAFQAELGRLRVREKAQTREDDAIAEAWRRLPMTEVDTILDCAHGPPRRRPAHELAAPARRIPHKAAATGVWVFFEDEFGHDHRHRTLGWRPLAWMCPPRMSAGDDGAPF